MDAFKVTSPFRARASAFERGVPGRSGHAWLPACLFVLLSVVCASVHADASHDAERHFERAVRLYQERAYDEALAEFQRAFELSPRYQVLFNIAQVHYQLNEYAEALRTFERYLSEGGREIPAERRAYVGHELSALRERVGTLEVVTDVSGASVLLDDHELGTTPLDPVLVDIGRHVVRVERRGHQTMTRRLNLASGQVVRLELALEPITVSAAQHPDELPQDGPR